MKWMWGVQQGMNMMLAMAGPLQPLLDRPACTHAMCNRQGLVIMANEGYESWARFLSQWRKELDAGSAWADSGWKNINHYYLPATRRGLWLFRDGASEGSIFFYKACRYARKNEWSKAIFFLGAALHLLQDMCVPHHVHGMLGNGHRAYETWVGAHKELYQRETGGIYDRGRFGEWVAANAKVAADCIGQTGGISSLVDYHQATEILLPLAQQTSAGLFVQFCRQAGLLRRISGVA